jgi:polar amino acid transport system permease protein
VNWVASLGEFIPALAHGALYTLALSAVSMACAVAAGLLVALARMSENRGLSRIAALYIDFIRGTPLLLQLFFIYYALPEIHIVFPVFVAGVLGLSLNFAAYLAELFRAGIQSVPKGQHQAARALGLTPYLRLRLVVLPQAIRYIFPAIGNYALVMLKDSSLTAVISVLELMRTGELLASVTFRYMEIYALVAAFYLAMSAVVAKLFRLGERALAIPGMTEREETRRRRPRLVPQATSLVEAEAPVSQGLEISSPR